MKYLDAILNTDVTSIYDEKYTEKYDWKPDGDKRPHIVKRVICNDGYSVSVQASETHYCSPRTKYATWNEVECGYPTGRPPESWFEYGEDLKYGNIADDFKMIWFWVIRKKWRTAKRYTYLFFTRLFGRMWSETIYPYIPVELVREYIEMHGGENTEACWAQYDFDQVAFAMNEERK